MKLQYLGTAAAEGFPAIFCRCDACTRARAAGGKNLRLRASVVINDTAMIDFCPDACAASQYLGVDLSRIRDIFIGHSHSDHFDVEDLAMRRSPVFCHPEKDEKVHLHVNEHGLRRLEEYMVYEHEHYSGYLDVTVLEYFKPYTAENGLVFTHLPARHAPDEKAGIYLVEGDDATVVYAHDTGRFPEETMAFLKTKHIDLISLDCCYGRNAVGGNHMGLPDNRVVVDELREAGALDEGSIIIVNHFTHNCGQLHEELEKEVENDGFIVAYDGMIIETK